jgi:short-subunit dehydrogenase
MIICITGASSGIGEATAQRLSREPGAELVLVARREDRLRELARSLPRATYVAVDLTDDDAPARVLAHLEEHHSGRLDVLVNNAGAAWRSTFADGGYENVRRTMELNFDAQVRLTEVLLPLLRAAQPSTLVNVSSTSGRVARAGAGAYSASKFALAGWSDSLAAEERANGVNVALILPGFIATEGFPQKELPGFLVSAPAVGAEAIADAIRHRRAERYVPRYYWLFAALRILAPRLVRRFVAGSGGQRLITATHPGDPHKPPQDGT